MQDLQIAEELDDRGSFEWCVENFSVAENPIFTAIGQTVCHRWTVWPEQLVGRAAAGDAVSDTDSPPIATGHSFVPSRVGRIVFPRRVAWHLAYQLGSEADEVSVEEVAEAFGGHSPKTVAPWVKDLSEFEKVYSGQRWVPNISQLMFEMSLGRLAYDLG